MVFPHGIRGLLRLCAGCRFKRLNRRTVLRVKCELAQKGQGNAAEMRELVELDGTGAVLIHHVQQSGHVLEACAAEGHRDPAIRPALGDRERDIEMRIFHKLIISGGSLRKDAVPAAGRDGRIHLKRTDAIDRDVNTFSGKRDTEPFNSRGLSRESGHNAVRHELPLQLSRVVSDIVVGRKGIPGGKGAVGKLIAERVVGARLPIAAALQKIGIGFSIIVVVPGSVDLIIPPAERDDVPGVVVGAVRAQKPRDDPRVDPGFQAQAVEGRGIALADAELLDQGAVCGVFEISAAAVFHFGAEIVINRVDLFVIALPVKGKRGEDTVHLIRERGLLLSRGEMEQGVVEHADVFIARGENGPRRIISAVLITQIVSLRGYTGMRDRRGKNLLGERLPVGGGGLCADDQADRGGFLKIHDLGFQLCGCGRNAGVPDPGILKKPGGVPAEGALHRVRNGGGLGDLLLRADRHRRNVGHVHRVGVGGVNIGIGEAVDLPHRDQVQTQVIGVHGFFDREDSLLVFIEPVRIVIAIAVFAGPELIAAVLKLTRVGVGERLTEIPRSVIDRKAAERLCLIAQKRDKGSAVLLLRRERGRALRAAHRPGERGRDKAQGEQ